MISFSHVPLQQGTIAGLNILDPKWDEPIDVYALRVNEPERTWPERLAHRKYDCL